MADVTLAPVADQTAALKRTYRKLIVCPVSNYLIVEEGQINRLKSIKRRMYGRAKFDLLRKQVLGAQIAA